MRENTLALYLVFILCSDFAFPNDSKQNDHDPSRLTAETPCKLVRYLLPAGTHVIPDTPFAEVEIMKMCMPLLAPAAGIISFHMSEGQAMQTGDLIATLDLDDPTAISQSQPFTGILPEMGDPVHVSTKVHQRFSLALMEAKNLLAGYNHDPETVSGYLACLAAIAYFSSWP